MINIEEFQNMPKMQWTIEECYSLIEAYREHPNLWNPSHADFKNRLKRFDSLKQIAQLLGTNAEEIARKLKNLRGQYQRERRNYKKLKKAGSGHTFRSRWFGYDAMSFLNDKNLSNQAGLDFEDIDSSDSNLSDSSVECKVMPTIQPEIQHPKDPLEQSSEHVYSQPTVSAHIKKHHPVSSCRSANATIPANTSTPKTSESCSVMNSVYEERQSVQQDRDEYTIFGELVAHKLRSLKTEFSRATVQYLINNILYDAQIGKYDFPEKNCKTGTPKISSADT